jgi:cell wall assembly regulator SMI1
MPGVIPGVIGRGGWSMNLMPHPLRLEPGRALLVSDFQAEHDAANRVTKAVVADGLDHMQFVVEISPNGRTLLYLIETGPAIEPGFSNDLPGTAILVEGAVPEPWRRSPEPYPKTPAQSADPELLERLLRERIPDTEGATDAEIDAAEERLGVHFPEELRVLYRVMHSWSAAEAACDDEDSEERAYDVLGCMPLGLNALEAVTPETRHSPWRFAANEALDTTPDDAVQGLVGSPGWICFGTTYGGDQVAIDLTPGPRGHLGQIIFLSHEQSTGAKLLASSLTDLVFNQSLGLEASSKPQSDQSGGGERRPPVVIVHDRSGEDVTTAAHAGLQVLRIGGWFGAPLSLAPVARLPKLRTLSARPGTIANPLEIAEMTGLEYLELGVGEWRTLLDAHAVPRKLKAAKVDTEGQRAHPLAAVAVINELLALWGRPQLKQTILEGQLPAPA